MCVQVPADRVIYASVGTEPRAAVRDAPQQRGVQDPPIQYTLRDQVHVPAVHGGHPHWWVARYLLYTEVIHTGEWPGTCCTLRSSTQGRGCVHGRHPHRWGAAEPCSYAVVREWRSDHNSDELSRIEKQEIYFSQEVMVYTKKYFNGFNTHFRVHYSDGCRLVDES